MSLTASSFTTILPHDEKSISALNRMVKTQYRVLMVFGFMIFNLIYLLPVAAFSWSSNGFDKTKMKSTAVIFPV